MSPTFSTSGSQNPRLLPFPPPSRGLWRGLLLPLLPSCDLEKLIDQVIDSELLPKTKLVFELSTVCKKGPLRSPAKPLPLPHEENEAQEGPGLPRITKGHGGPRSLPPAQRSLGSPKLSDSWPEHLLPPWSPWEGRVWERKEPREPSAWGWPRRAQGSLNGRDSTAGGDSSPVGSASQPEAQLRFGEGNCPKSATSLSPVVTAWENLPANLKRPGSLHKGAGERGTKGKGEKKVWVSLCISPQDAPPSIPGPVLVLSTIP